MQRRSQESRHVALRWFHSSKQARESGEFSRLSVERAVEYFMLMLFGQMKFLEFDKTRPELFRPAKPSGPTI